MQPLKQGRPILDLGLGDREFAYLAELIHERTGIVLGTNKREMLQARLSKRLRLLGLESFGDYCALLSSPDGQDELGHAVNAVTTNLTRFFREPHHFEHLAEQALPELIERRAAEGRRLRLWSAGCASGEEAYSMAIVLQSVMSDVERWDARILATDIDTTMVARGSEGRYEASQTELVPGRLRQRFLKPAGGSHVEVDDSLKRLVAFKPLNLLGAWPMKGKFDIIFCRNVVIYFDRDTQIRLFRRFADILHDDGYLYVGHSESLYGLCNQFKLVGRTIHRKVLAREAPAL